MTQEDLDALPEITLMVALWQKEDEPMSVVDASGQRWMVGWHKGERVKRKMA